MLIVLGRSLGLPIFYPGGDFLDIPYTLIRSSRRTISIEITPEGSLLVRAPRRLSDRAVREFVLSREHWIREKLARVENRPRLPKLTKEELEALKQRAKEYLPGRVALYAPRVGVSYGRVTIRAHKSRWGSCSREGNLNFNCLLMLAPSEIRDYVVVHELCHRKHMNHAAPFWVEVERVMPGFRLHRQWLKDNGAILIARLPD